MNKLLKIININIDYRLFINVYCTFSILSLFVVFFLKKICIFNTILFNQRIIIYKNNYFLFLKFVYYKLKNVNFFYVFRFLNFVHVS